MEESSRGRRRILLIDQSFQMRFAFFVSLWVFALSLIFPFIIYSVFESFTLQIQKSLLEAGIDKQVNFSVASRNQLIFLLIGLESFFIGLTILLSVFISHRIAGPLFKLRKSMELFRNGKPIQHIQFRKSDYFQDLAAEYNRFLDWVEKRK